MHPPVFYFLILFLRRTIISSYRSGSSAAEITDGFSRGGPNPTGERVRALHFLYSKRICSKASNLIKFKREVESY